MNDLSILLKKDNKKLKNKELTKPNFWTEEEDKILKEKAKEFKYKNWNSIANFIPGRTSIQCSARYRRIRPGLIKGAWDKDEDNKLLSLYEKYGKNWAAISKEMPQRTGKQIRDRFLNSLDTKFERGKFTEEEDQTIIKYYKIYGNSWAKIAKKLKTRTGDMVKNRFYSSLKKSIFKSKSLLKRKRERQIHHKNKTKCEEVITTNAIVKNTLFEQKNSTDSTQESLDKKETKKTKENSEKKELSNILEDIKESIQENDEINNQKNKMCNNVSTNVVSYDSNNYSIENNENKSNHLVIKNSSVNTSSDINENISSKNDENENENKIENNNNNVDFQLDENNKKNEIINFPEFNDNFGINCDLFMELNDNINNNFNALNQKDEVDERLEKLKNFPKNEFEYKQNLKEQLDIISDLENIINQKLFSVQRELENN